VDTFLNIDSVDVVSRSVYNKRSAGVNGRLLAELNAFDLAFGIDWLSGSLGASAEDSSFGTNIFGPWAPFDYSYISHSYWSAVQNQLDLWSAVAWEPAEAVRFDVSGRLQFIRDRDRQESYNLGAVLVPLENLRLKLGYGYAFRLPTLAEQFADDVFTAGNLALLPETSRTGLASLAWYRPDRELEVRLTYFDQRVSSLVQYVYDPTIFRSVPQNVDRFNTCGIDIALRLDRPGWPSLTWSAVHQRARQTAGGGVFVTAYNVPELKWRADIGRSFAGRRISLSAGVTYTSGRQTVLWGGADKRLAKVYELSLSMFLRLTRHLSLRLSGDDLTDQARPDQFGFMPADGDYPTAGRRFLLEARFALK
jgi:outer membrane receptor protein involved in Fe transport